MNDDYLWDGSGTPDPQVEAMERALGGLRYDEPLHITPPRRFARPSTRAMIAAAAVVVVGVGLTTWLVAGGRDTPRVAGTGPAAPTPRGAACIAGGGDHSTSWRVDAVAGAPRCGAERVAADTRLTVGGWLETDGTSRAQIEVADIGQVVVDPNSRVRLVATRAEEHRLELARGRMHAVINAPPRLFMVDTPSGTAVDLGCAYTLEVDDRGVSHLDVTSGYVAVAHQGRETLVPAGYIAESRPGHGPTPTMARKASPALRRAVLAYSFDGNSDAALDDILRLATPADTITLWHLLPLVRGAQCARVDARLAALAGRPDGAVWGASRCDAAAIKAWRTSLEATWMGGSVGRWLDDAVDKTRKKLAPK